MPPPKGRQKLQAEQAAQAEQAVRDTAADSLAEVRRKRDSRKGDKVPAEEGKVDKVPAVEAERVQFDFYPSV